MALPRIELPTDTVNVGGEEIAVRGLSRKEVLSLSKHTADPEKADVLAVSWGCNVSEQDAEEWLDCSPSGITIEVISKIMELSGMGDIPKD